MTYFVVLQPASVKLE